MAEGFAHEAHHGAAARAGVFSWNKPDSRLVMRRNQKSQNDGGDKRFPNYAPQEAARSPQYPELFSFPIVRLGRWRGISLLQLRMDGGSVNGYGGLTPSFHV